jgi:hypothetical protein
VSAAASAPPLREAEPRRSRLLAGGTGLDWHVATSFSPRRSDRHHTPSRRSRASFARRFVVTANHRGSRSPSRGSMLRCTGAAGRSISDRDLWSHLH